MADITHTGDINITVETTSTGDIISTGKLLITGDLTGEVDACTGDSTNGVALINIPTRSGPGTDVRGIAGLGGLCLPDISGGMNQVIRSLISNAAAMNQDPNFLPQLTKIMMQQVMIFHNSLLPNLAPRQPTTEPGQTFVGTGTDTAGATNSGSAKTTPDAASSARSTERGGLGGTGSGDSVSPRLGIDGVGGKAGLGDLFGSGIPEFEQQQFSPTVGGAGQTLVEQFHDRIISLEEGHTQKSQTEIAQQEMGQSVEERLGKVEKTLGQKISLDDKINKYIKWKRELIKEGKDGEAEFEDCLKAVAAAIGLLMSSFGAIFTLKSYALPVLSMVGIATFAATY